MGAHARVPSPRPTAGAPRQSPAPTVRTRSARSWPPPRGQAVHRRSRRRRRGRRVRVVGSRRARARRCRAGRGRSARTKRDTAGPRPGPTESGTDREPGPDAHARADAGPTHLPDRLSIPAGARPADTPVRPVGVGVADRARDDVPRRHRSRDVLRRPRRRRPRRNGPRCRPQVRRPDGLGRRPQAVQGSAGQAAPVDDAADRDRHR